MNLLSRHLNECLQNFSTLTKDISVWLTSEQVLFKSYYDDTDEQGLWLAWVSTCSKYIFKSLSSDVTTSFAYKAIHFRDYAINNEISVTFNLKDLRVMHSSMKISNIKYFFFLEFRWIRFVWWTGHQMLFRSFGKVCDNR